MISIFVVGLILYLFNELYWKRKNLPPGPTPLPFFGNLLTILKQEPGYEAYNSWTRKYGPVYTYWLGPFPFVMVSDYTTLKETFVRQGDAFTGKFNFEKITTEFRGGTYGVIDTVGETWREHRRFALHQFKNFGLGKNIMEQKVIEEIEAITKSLLNDIKAGSVDIKKAYDVAVGNVINQLLFGYRFDETRIDKFYELKDMMSRQMKDFSHPIASLMFIYPSLRYLPYFNGLWKRMTNYRDRFYSFFDSQIVDHEREVDYNLDESTDYVEAYLKEKKRRETVDDEQFSLIQLKNMCLDLWFAGMETTSNTLSWGTVYILNYPDVQVHLHEELDRVIGSGRPVMMADRNLLPYTCAVVNEIQRLANLLPLNLLHQTTRDVNIGGYRISKGMGIVAQISSVLYDEKLFPSPLSFDPSRFMDENGRLKKVEELIPFSIGLRQCLGEGLARMELFLFIANIFNRFQFSCCDSSSPPSMKKNFAITVQPHSFLCIANPRYG